MYEIDVEIVGTAILLQNRFEGDKGNHKATTTEIDWSQSWRKALYVKDGMVVQPSDHILGSMTKAAASFKIQGKRGKTYKDAINAFVMIEPVYLSHGIPVPEELSEDADQPIYVDIRPVVVQRNRVERYRPALKEGWKLAFKIICIDDGLPSSVLNDVLILAGRTVGIGDHRPRFGRFMVSRFELEH
jgi:hypothetical protein